MVIASSPYIKFLLNEVNGWKNQLTRVQDVLEEWKKVQKGWLYLWPIFSSDDIQKSIPHIAQYFTQVDKIWRTIMDGTLKNP